MKLDAMWDHIERLAAQHDIKVDTGRVDQPAGAFAVHWDRRICIPPLRSAAGYATAPHEIGHVVLGWCADDDREIEQERAAWDWARRNALVWTPAMERCATSAFARISSKAARRASAR